MQYIFLKIDKILLLLFACLSCVVQAQTYQTTQRINWQTFDNYSSGSFSFVKFTTFNEAIFPKKPLNHLPHYQYIVELPATKVLSVDIKPLQTEEAKAAEIQQHTFADRSGNIEVAHTIGYNKGKPSVIVTFVPLRYNASKGVFDKLVTFEIIIRYQSTPQQNQSLGKKPNYAANSVLAFGDWIKIGVVNTGVHLINKNSLRTMGLNIDAIDPRTIKIYGNGAGVLPQKNADFRYDDLVQNAILVQGENDGVFNENDAILFYGQSQKDVWRYNTGTDSYTNENNIYADTTYYFLTYGGATGKRITEAASTGTPNFQSSTYDWLYKHEIDAVNLIKSGRVWLGEEFDKVPTQSFVVSPPGLLVNQPIRLTSSVVARSFANSNFSVSVNNIPVINHQIPAIPGRYDSPFASNADGYKSVNFNSSSPTLSVLYNYTHSSPGSVGWLDFFEITARCQLALAGGQLVMRDSKSIASGRITEFSVASFTASMVWDITNPMGVQLVPATFAANTVKFSTATDSLKTFLLFNGTQFFSPASAQRMANQNLHANAAADLLIVTHPLFINQALVLADFHRTYSGLKVNVVNVMEIYNEFSSGAQDVSAIRDYVRMVYNRAAVSERPKYLTLFGRASYDYKYRLAGNTNYVPTFCSNNSLDPVASYNSDDYYGLLDDNEGRWETDNDLNNEILDIAIGRLPAQDITQANNMLAKIIRYASAGDYNDWRTKIVFIADDEDSGIHTYQADGLANYATTNFKNYNIKKIFIDAYKEELGTGGQRNPIAQQEIVKSVEQGALIVNYTGHGGEVGWAEERILNTDDINGWQNGLKLPLFVTATCEFSRFDDPGRTSAGEMVLLNPVGGGIALFTTVRLVNSGANLALNTAFYKRVGLDSASLRQPKTMGEIMRLTKNDYIDLNTRNFTLLGDPALYLAMPKAGVTALTINSKPIQSVMLDTLKALQTVSVSGRMIDLNGNPLTTFNGIIYPTIYDKSTQYRTISNNPASPIIPFTLQNNVIFRGQASVKDGNFSFSFVVPKDIAYQIGNGKMSFYAQNGTSDAMGIFDGFLIGGTADSVAKDDKGPDIRIFMNDEKFVFGGITDENPLMIVKLSDINGINITGKGIGRDISLTLNKQVENMVSLNDYYQGKLDDYSSGEVRFRLKGLTPGNNSLVIKAWDTHNNPSESLLDFVVAGSEKMAIKQVLNYPNPFTTNTTFHFDHNKAGLPLHVMIQVYTISGKLLKTMQTESINSGNHFDNISWDGRDDYGDALGKGVYVYKVLVKSGNGETAEAYQKLVILN